MCRVGKEAQKGQEVRVSLPTPRLVSYVKVIKRVRLPTLTCQKHLELSQWTITSVGTMVQLMALTPRIHLKTFQLQLSGVTKHSLHPSTHAERRTSDLAHPGQHPAFQDQSS